MRTSRPTSSRPQHFLACAVVMLGTRPAAFAVAAATSPAELSLSWAAPAGCPPTAAVEAEFVRLLGGPRRPPSSKRIRVQATVRRVAADKWSVQLETDVDGARGRRSLEGDSCRSIATASALILALTIDPDAANRAQATRAEPPAASTATTPAPPPSRSTAASPTPKPLPSSPPLAPSRSASPPSPPPAPAPSPSAPPVASAAAEPARPPEAPTPEGSPPEQSTAEAPDAAPRPPVDDAPIATVVTAPRTSGAWPVRPFLRTFVGGTLALLPQPAAVAGLAVGARRGRLEVEISGLASQERRAQAPDRPTAGGDFRLLAVGARGCGRIGSGWLIARLCAGGEIEKISARASGVEAPSWGTAILGAAMATGVLAAPLGQRFELALEVTGSLRPYRPAFTLDTLGRIFVVPAAAALATLGLAVNL